ncbi:uncharacterized protein [Miscanthus floridulus]|uniref:uncharacterized protein n=1 Tax=Miscanthus floridulus TaxID=154761 RepID=UPI00345AE5B1
MPPVIPSIPASTISAMVTTVPPPAPPPQLTAIPTDALNSLTAAIYGMQRQMGDISSRLAAVEGRSPASAPPFLPYGLPGYGGILQLPASGPIISEISSGPPLMPSVQASAPPVPASAPVSTQPGQPSMGVPITHINFSHSPSPVTDYVLEEPEDDDPPADTDATATAEPATFDPETPMISLHAIAGIRTEDTMQLYITVGNEQFVALLDSGSKHNFIRGDVARRVGLQFQACPGAGVIVANGDRVACRGLARDIGIRIADEMFTIDCYSIPIDSYDMVLGITFLRTLGPILWDFDDLCMAFWREGCRVFWRGIGSTRHDVQSTRRLHALRSNEPVMLELLLNSFEHVFADPRGLPPARPCDDRIHLLPNTAPVAVRPYRDPQLQKDDLEAQCAAMLEQGIIRPSTSAFSAPVLLVKKHDGSWRFCVDYRALNQQTVKDKFPIPVVEELLDELHGARFFTKLDLRSGYHQVRMYAEDVEKTAFHTHEGHFEFLVMPFGLTNVPSTFQSLMNSVLRPFLHKFVLVFFDDILIYSPSWSTHLQHINAVLTALRDHHLRLKRSKCSFATTSVAYLGHKISAEGVAMDRTKVDAVTSWPQLRSVRALRGFLGLAGYYRRIIQDYGAIATPLTQLLRKEAFVWSPEATAAFQALKRALSTAPVLHLPDFDKQFTVDGPKCKNFTTAASVAKAFFDNIVRLHSLPNSIVSDRDPVFTGNVWRDIFKLAGVKLRMSTAFHPQMDGQSEAVNKIIVMYLRCVTGNRLRSWLDWLPWAEYCYNTLATDVCDRPHGDRYHSV